MVFQELVNTYGVPRYQEINPAYFYIITFPFFFGMMFGDVVHGFFFLCLGLYMIIQADSIKKNPDSLIRPLIAGRYVIAMMGFFALFCGFIYNDFAAVPLPLSHSCYRNIKVDKTESWEGEKIDGCEYYFGLDHKWYTTTNELAFINSMKMKISVVFGIIHMFGGIILKGVNLAYFNLNVEFICEFIPQIIFFFFLFIYMNILIFIKWLTVWKVTPPSITMTILNVVLKAGGMDKENVSVLKLII